MSDSRHLRSDHYALAREGKLGRGAFALHLHTHLVGVCPTCAEAWELLAEGRGPLRSLLAEVATRGGSGQCAEGDDGEAGDSPLHLETAHSWEARRIEEEIREIRAIRLAACKGGWELLQVPLEERAEKVRIAFSRYRSRAEAEYFLDKAREVIHDDPREAENLAALVPLILHWMPEAEAAPWAVELLARAEAWRANALRVAGDLPAADRIFPRLRSRLATAPVEDRAALAEVYSLEASLRIDQRRFDEAHHLLDLAALLYSHAGDADGELRAKVKQGNLWVTEGEPRQALGYFRAAADLLSAGKKADSRLLMVIVNNCIACLCDLESYQAAAELLEQNLELFEESNEVQAGAVVRHHRGRIALGLHQYQEAEKHLVDARDAFTTVGRNFDALLVTLDLAVLLCVTSRRQELRKLASHLMVAFRSRKVERETMAALRLLVDSFEPPAVSIEALQQLRQRISLPAPPT